MHTHTLPSSSLNSDELVWSQNSMKGVVNNCLKTRKQKKKTGKCCELITGLFSLFLDFFVFLSFNYTLLSPEIKLWQHDKLWSC